MMFQATPSVAYMKTRISTWSGNGPVKTKGKAIRSAATTPAMARSLPATEALGLEPDDEEIEHEDDGVLVGRVEEVAAQRLHQPDQDAGDERAGDAAEPAQRDDGEGDEAEEAADAGIDIVIHGEKSARDADQRGADAEREGIDPLDVDPHEQRGAAVHLGGEDGLAGLAPVQEEHQHRGDDHRAHRSDELDHPDLHRPQGPGAGEERLVDGAEVRA